MISENNSRRNNPYSEENRLDLSDNKNVKKAV